MSRLRTPAIPPSLPQAGNRKQGCPKFGLTNASSLSPKQCFLSPSPIPPHMLSEESCPVSREKLASCGLTPTGRGTGASKEACQRESS